MGKGRAPCCDKTQVKKGPWSPAEDLRLVTFIHNHGHENWRALPKQAGLFSFLHPCILQVIIFVFFWNKSKKHFFNADTLPDSSSLSSNSLFFFLKKNLSIYSHECHVSNLKRGYNSLVVLTQTTSRKTSLKRLINIMSDKFIDYCSRFSTDQNNILSICCFLILMNSSH